MSYSFPSVNILGGSSPEQPSREGLVTAMTMAFSLSRATPIITPCIMPLMISSSRRGCSFFQVAVNDWLEHVVYRIALPYLRSSWVFLLDLSVMGIYWSAQYFLSSSAFFQWGDKPGVSFFDSKLVCSTASLCLMKSVLHTESCNALLRLNRYNMASLHRIMCCSHAPFQWWNRRSVLANIQQC